MRCTGVVPFTGQHIITVPKLITIDGSKDRRSTDSMTDVRSRLSGLDQPVRNFNTFVCQAGKQTYKGWHICTMLCGALLLSATDTNYMITKAKLTESYRPAQVKSDGSASLKSVGTDSKTPV